MLLAVVAAFMRPSRTRMYTISSVWQVLTRHALTERRSDDAIVSTVIRCYIFARICRNIQCLHAFDLLQTMLFSCCAYAYISISVFRRTCTVHSTTCIRVVHRAISLDVYVVCGVIMCVCCVCMRSCMYRLGAIINKTTIK